MSGTPDIPVIEAHELTKHYGATVGLEGLNLTVHPGEVFGFLGPNGAGKTTTIRLLLDLIRPTRGQARLFGSPSSEPSVRGRIGYLPGELVLDPRLTGAQTLQFMQDLLPATARPARRRDEYCERLGLSTIDLGRRVRDYSRGMKQKLGLVTALQHDPELLVLDEPTTALDPLVREAFFEILVEAGRQGKTVFHSSHVLSEVDRTCTRVGIIRKGQLLNLERIDEMRKASVRRMVIGFNGEAPVGELDLPGISIVEQRNGRVTLRVTGELDPLLRVLARHSVRHLEFAEPSLEEAFVEYYRPEEERPR